MIRIFIFIIILSGSPTCFPVAQGKTWQSGLVKISNINYSALDSVVELWAADYAIGNPDNLQNRGYAVATDAMGNVYVAGSGDSDFVTLKYDLSGDLKWAARYDGPGNSLDMATAIAVDDSGYVVVTGFSWDSLDTDYATIMYTPSGTEQWVARYDGPGHSFDFVTALALDPVGSAYVTGYSMDSISHLYDYATVKYNRSGIEQWVARYDGLAHSNDHAWSIGLDPLGNVYVTGNSNSGHSFDYATVKYDPLGVEQWVARYNGPDSASDHGRSLAVDDSGNTYVTGESGFSPNYDILTVKYNSMGEQQWAARYDGPLNMDDYGVVVKSDGFGNTYVTGSSVGAGPRIDIATLKYDGQGNQVWSARFRAPESATDVPVGMIVDNTSNVYLVGYSSPGAENDYVTIKYDSSGVIAWAARYNGLLNADDQPTSITLDPEGNIVVTGSSTIVGGTQITTLKYAQVVTTVDSETDLPTRFMLSNSYPNPFNSSTEISFSIPTTTRVTLSVFDLTGRLVSVLREGVLDPGKYNIHFDGSSLSSGIYLLRLSGNGHSQVQSLILLR